MNDLETALRELDVEWPETPDFAAAVTARIAVETRGEHAAGDGDAAGSGIGAGGGTTPRGWGRLRRPPVRGWRARLAYLAAAVVLLGGGTLAASPQARSDVLRWLGLKSVEIKREEPRPTVGRELDLGTPLARVPRGTRVPKALGEPDTAYDTPLADGSKAVSMVYKGPPMLLVQVFRARATPFIEKTIGQGSAAERLTIDGAHAYWITGAHGFAYQSAKGFGYEDQRLADRTLLLERDGLLIRVEGDIARDRAVAIARSVY